METFEKSEIETTVVPPAKSTRPKKIYSIDEALDVLYQNEVTRNTFVRKITEEKWPTIRIMKRIFLPAKFVDAKLAEIDAVADAALAAAGVNK